MDSSAQGHPGCALVTGASSGIGQAFARRLGREGYDLILVARRRERLVALAEDLQESGRSADVMVADLTEPSDLDLVEERLRAEADLTMVVNNAGRSTGPFLTASSDTIESTLRLHVVAPTRLVRAALPSMIERGRGAIINVASMAAFRTAAGLGSHYQTVYAPTKAFLVTLSLRLHDELAGSGIRVQALCPGFVRTEMIGPERMKGLVPSEGWMTVDDVVQASLAGLEKGEVVCCPNLERTDLLDQLNRTQDAIVAEAVSTGSLAQRYHASSPE